VIIISLINDDFHHHCYDIYYDQNVSLLSSLYLSITCEYKYTEVDVIFLEFSIHCTLCSIERVQIQSIFDTNDPCSIGYR